MDPLNKRKNEHLDHALNSQEIGGKESKLFNYEPLFGTHSKQNLSTSFLGKTLKYPFVISSMTGGTDQAQRVNHVLAKASKSLGIGMNLGSCRALLLDEGRFDDFNLRPYLGSELPFYSNLGIAQIEETLKSESIVKILEMQERLDVDGLIIHVNPLQEFFQYNEGDKLKSTPFETLSRFRKHYEGKLIIKEVGQGFGPRSLNALIDLKVDCIELSGLGGTNFTKLESKRFGRETPYSKVGHTCEEMIHWLNELDSTIPIIISGGVNDSLSAYRLRKLYQGYSVLGQASQVLKHAMIGEEAIVAYVQSFFNEYCLAEQFLDIRKSES